MFARLGYGFRLRPKEAAIEEKYKPQRIKHCSWLLKRDQWYLNRLAYTDGTTLYLPRTEDEFPHDIHAT